MINQPIDIKQFLEIMTDTTIDRRVTIGRNFISDFIHFIPEEHKDLFINEVIQLITDASQLSPIKED